MEMRATIKQKINQKHILSKKFKQRLLTLIKDADKNVDSSWSRPLLCFFFFFFEWEGNGRG